MSFRVLLSPAVEVLPRPAPVGVTADNRIVDAADPEATSVVQPRAWWPKAERYCRSAANQIVVRADRTAHPLALTFGFATDWTAADADPDVDTLFQSGPTATLREFKQALATRTFGDFSQNARDRLRQRLTALGIPHADLDDTTTLARLIRRIRATIIENEAIEFHIPAR